MNREENPSQPQNTLAHLIVYKDRVQEESTHYFPWFSIGLFLSLIKCIIYLGF